MFDFVGRALSLADLRSIVKHSLVLVEQLVEEEERICLNTSRPGIADDGIGASSRDIRRGIIDEHTCYRRPGDLKSGSIRYGCRGSGRTASNSTMAAGVNAVGYRASRAWSCSHFENDSSTELNSLGRRCPGMRRRGQRRDGRTPRMTRGERGYSVS